MLPCVFLHVLPKTGCLFIILSFSFVFLSLGIPLLHKNTKSPKLTLSSSAAAFKLALQLLKLRVHTHTPTHPRKPIQQHLLSVHPTLYVLVVFHLLITPLEYQLLKARPFFFIHCCIPSTGTALGTLQVLGYSELEELSTHYAPWRQEVGLK